MGSDRIKITNEIKYLGIFIVSGKHFACNLHACKIKFFRALNAILGKIGDMSALSLILTGVQVACKLFAGYNKNS